MGGQARMIAVAASQRVPSHPDVPTAAEQGFAVDASTWRGLATSKGTPREVLAKLGAAIRRALDDEGFKAFMDQQGFGIRYLDAAGFERFLAEQDARYRAYFGT